MFVKLLLKYEWLFYSIFYYISKEASFNDGRIKKIVKKRPLISFSKTQAIYMLFCQ